jgi:hypothetical protein
MGEKKGEAKSVVALRRRLELRVWDHIILHYITLYHKRNEWDRIGRGKHGRRRGGMGVIN